MSRRTICLDFDGVLHSYKSGWKGADTVSDEPVPGSQNAVRELIEMGYDVAVFSSRSMSREGRLAMIHWLEESGFPAFSDSFYVSEAKPAALLYVDDRGYRFDGSWHDLLYSIENEPHVFTPWNKR